VFAFRTAALLASTTPRSDLPARLLSDPVQIAMKRSRSNLVQRDVIVGHDGGEGPLRARVGRSALRVQCA
jgi:hypothetical protein